MPIICAVLFNNSFFFFNDTATTEIYTLSLHDALPICVRPRQLRGFLRNGFLDPLALRNVLENRSEEHTSELQSQSNLVCRLLLEKKIKCVASSSSRSCKTPRAITISASLNRE